MPFPFVKALPLLSALWIFAPCPVLAQSDAILSPADEILSTLLSRGYVIVEDERTWLGRQRVVAVKDDTRREIVFIPGTGEILRDYSVRQDDRNEFAADHGAGNSGAAVSSGGTGATATPDATPSVSVGDSLGTGRGDVSVSVGNLP